MENEDDLPIWLWGHLSNLIVLHELRMQCTVQWQKKNCKFAIINKEGPKYFIRRSIIDTHRFYFDSYGQLILQKVVDYLKTDAENQKPVIPRNTDIVQDFDTRICGHLSLYVLKSFSIGKSFRDINFQKRNGDKCLLKVFFKIMYLNEVDESEESSQNHL